MCKIVVLFWTVALMVAGGMAPAAEWPKKGPFVYQKEFDKDSPLFTFVQVTDTHIAAGKPVESTRKENAGFLDSFDQAKRWKLTCHADGEAGARPKETGTTFGTSDTVRYADGPACRLHYNFTTGGHDAVILSREVKVESAGAVKLAVHGDASGHRLFCVLTDASGERHFLSICEKIDWKGWKVLQADLEGLAKGPPKHVVEATHFGGDRNQKLDCPVTALAIGLDDRPDTFVGSGDIYLGLVEISCKENK